MHKVVDDLSISVIVVMTLERVIGNNGDLLCKLPSDLRRFRDITKEVGTVLIGNTTFKSIVARIGKPLPERKHIVLTRGSALHEYEMVQFVTSPEEALEKVAMNGRRACVIGGAQIYELFMPIANTLHITTVHASLEGDTRFPDVGTTGWLDINYRTHKRPVVQKWDPRDEYETSFATYKRPTYVKKLF